MGASIIAAIWTTLMFTSSVYAQQQPSSPPPTVLNPSTGENLRAFFSLRTPYEFWLTCLIGLIGLMIVGALILSVGRIERRRPEDIIRPVIVVTVITGTLILVTAGYSNEQIAPAFGVFGTIVGYILGRMTPQPTPGQVQGDRLLTSEQAQAKISKGMPTAIGEMS